MKKIEYIFVSLILLVSFFACTDNTNQTAALDETAITKVYPTNVVTNQNIYIVGSNLDKVTEVILPGNIAITNFERTGFNQISVVVPEGMKSGYITLKAGDKEFKSPTAINAVTPSFTKLFPDSVLRGEVLTIKGENLLEIKQVILRGTIGIDALYFKRKSDTEIQVTVPAGTDAGKATVTMVTLSGATIKTSDIEIKQLAVVVPPVDAITAKTIILVDWEAHGGHNGGWDNSWDGVTEVLTSGTPANTYLRVKTDATGKWIINCNHQSNIGAGATWPWTIAAAENYVLKVDVLIPTDVDGTKIKDVKFSLGGKNYSYADAWPKTTDGAWKSIRVPFTKLSVTGGLDFSAGVNGMSGTVPTGVCFDNLRVDPVAN